MVEDKKISKKRNRTDVDSEDDNNTNDTDYHRSRKKRASMDCVNFLKNSQTFSLIIL